MADTVTLVNVVEVTPERRGEVLALLEEGAERVISRRPGCIDLTLLEGLDGRRIIVVARWHSAEAAHATQADPAAAEYARRVAELGVPHPTVSRVVREFSG